ncbi:uncharacterized protein [Ovis canadensis]|uniref:uncharacterized protein n=1 Tax=Ovis canadensis TaxID=37174 RepID=UPI0037536B5F
MLSQQSCKTYKERFSFLAPLPGQSPRSIPPGLQTYGQERAPGKGGSAVRGSKTTPTRPRAPGRQPVPAAPRAALPTAVGEGPGGVARRKPLPGVSGPRAAARLPEGAARGMREALTAGPTPRHPARPGLTQPAAAPCRSIHLPASSRPRHFPASASVSPPPPISPLTPCHSPPHRPAAVPPSSSSPAAAAAAVCSVPFGARDGRREVEAI